MPAVTIQAIRNKKLAKKSRRQIERENKIEELGGIRVQIPLCEPLEGRSSLDRSKYLRKLKGFKRTVYPTKRAEELSQKEYVRKSVQAAKARTNGTKIPFDLDWQTLDLPEKCPVFGIPLVIGGPVRENSPSLDRIIPEEGYVEGNVCFISNRANRLKSDASIEELESILEYMKGF